MKKICITVLLCALRAAAAQAQLCGNAVWTASPAILSENSGAVLTLTFGCDYTWNNSDDVYIWLWAKPGDIHNSGQGTWEATAESHRMTKVGDRTYQFTIAAPLRSFFGFAEGTLTEVGALAKTRTAANNSKTPDQMFPLGQGFNARITAPQPNSFWSAGSNVSVTFAATESAALSLYYDGALRTGVSGTELQHTLTGVAEGNHTIVGTAQKDGLTAADTLHFIVPSAVTQSPVPAGIEDGVNYDPSDAGRATLSLFAPNKTNVYVVGDFTQWIIDSRYQMQKDGDRFWLSIDGLEAGREYAYQYVIDQTLRIADPYAEKILDPDNDSYISAAVYPNLKPYPSGKTTGIVSVLQTAAPQYSWSDKPYSAPPKEKLAIYELLVRDFNAAHTFAAVIDSLHYIKSLGVNAIELLPVNEFEGNDSWGYNPSFYFAPDKYYGAGNELKRLVDSCHANGIAVITDLVLNHSYGQSPLAQMYWDAEHSRPAADNPYYNAVSPNTDYSWGCDFNHESPATQRFIDRVNKFWLTEYKFDGIRFDFTKGFTNTAGNGWAYDAQRIAILKRMTDSIRSHSPQAYIIFEHLADNNEEKVLADYGIMLWGNVNNASCEAAMGYNDNGKSDLAGASYKNRGWSSPLLVAYMESHDEERLMYKAKKWGAALGVYDIKRTERALERAALCAAVFFAIPGPKMLWQFGELGYDYSINACTGGNTEEEGCRTAAKPVRWDYVADKYRRNLYLHCAEILRLRSKYDVFHTADFSTSLRNAVKYVILRSSEMNVLVVGNFALTRQQLSVTLPSQGTWRDYFAQTAIAAADLQNLTLDPGEYRIFSDVPIERISLPYQETPPLPTAINANAAETAQSYPNPVRNTLTINLERKNGEYDGGQITLEVYDVQGAQVMQKIFGGISGQHTLNADCSALAEGLYVYALKNQKGKIIHNQKFIIIR